MHLFNFISVTRNILTLVVFLILLVNSSPIISQTVSDTFDTAEIPTSLLAYSQTCNGPLSKLSIQLPPGGPWLVTGIDIAYSMTAQAGGLKSHQRSYVRCQNTSISEASIYQGTGNAGIQTYNRTSVDIANGSYSANTILRFEMRAWRTAIGAGCNTTYNRVDNFTWIITVHYSQIADEGSIGVGTTTPETSAILDLSSTTQAFLPPRMTTAQRNAIANPVPGMMIYNITTQKLEVFSSGWGAMDFTTPSIKGLHGGTNYEVPFSIQQLNDGGYIVIGNSGSSNSGSITGLINNGPDDILVIRLDATGSVIWQKLLGGSQYDFGDEVIQSDDGGFIIAGGSSSSNSGTLSGLTNNGSADCWIIKLDINGNIVWQFLYGGTGNDYAQGLCKTNDGGYIIAATATSSNTGTLTGLVNNGMRDYWIFKLNSNGVIVWQYLLGGSQHDEPYSITETSDSKFIIAGTSFSSNTGTLTGLTNNGFKDFWIVKLDASGILVWQYLYGGDDDDDAYSIAKTTDGGAIIGGISRSTPSGTFVGLTDYGFGDQLIMRIDESGNVLWQKMMGGNFDEICWSIQQTTDGGFVSLGFTDSANTGSLAGITGHGNSDCWIVRYDANGLVMWQKLLGGSNSDYGFSIDQTSDNGFILASRTYSSNTGTLIGITNNGVSDYWIQKLDPNGNLY